MTLKYFNVKNGLSTGNIFLHSGNSNVVANTFIGNLSVTGSANLGNVANISIQGGSNGYVLQTDGSGNLSWAAQTGGGSSGQSVLPDTKVDTFTGDGSTNSFQLSASPTTKDYVIVNVDGVFQFGDSYTLTGNTISFGSVPLTNSVIEIRTMIPGAVTLMSNGTSNVKVYNNGNVVISSNGAANVLKVSTSDVTIAGNIIPASNVTYNLGSPDHSFKDLYLSGNTLYFGGATIKSDGNTGAIAIIPIPTANTPNPTGIVITTVGTITTVPTSNGNITSNAISNAVANTSSIGYASMTYVDSAIANLVNSAPTALDTLKELASALGNDASYSTTITNALANKLSTSAFTYANISGAPTLGNIATINKDGNASNILYGNGVFAGAPITFGNSNVSTLLSSFGSNTITTTGNISVGNIIGNGQALTGITGANVTGFVPNANVANTAYSVAVANVAGIGNIATINKDGNSSNILYGNGTFAAAPVTYGNSNVATFLASFGSNTIVTTGNITAGNANLGNSVTSNYFLGNGSLLTGIARASSADSVANGNSNVNILTSNGNVTIASAGNTVATVTGTGINVAGYLTTTGNITAGNLAVSGLANLGAVANVRITGGTTGQYLKTDGTGNLSWSTVTGGSATSTYVKTYYWKGGLVENVGTLRHYVPVASANINTINAYLVNAGTTQSTVVVKKNGTSINTITFAANATSNSQSGLSLAITSSDYLTVDITQSSSATDLYINFIYQG